MVNLIEFECSRGLISVDFRYILSNGSPLGVLCVGEDISGYVFDPLLAPCALFPPELHLLEVQLLIVPQFGGPGLEFF